MTNATAPQHIQSKKSGVIYTYSYTLNSGLHAYTDPDNFIMIPTHAELENDFHDVTELENRLRAELAKVETFVFPRQIKSNRDNTLYYWVSDNGKYATYETASQARIQNITREDLETVYGCGPRFRIHAQ